MSASEGELELFRLPALQGGQLMTTLLRGGFALLVAVVLYGLLPLRGAAADGQSGTDKSEASKGTVSGIVIDKREGWIKVKLDGQEEPVTYTIDPDNKRVVKAMSGIFTVARVRLTYQTRDDKRQVVGIEKTGRQGVGTVTGKVLATHEWWVEIKPRKGPPEGFAATYPAEKWKATVEQIKELQAGDEVVISYFTDLERHRIKSIRKVGK
jgi:hypothetical protein